MITAYHSARDGTNYLNDLIMVPSLEGWVINSAVVAPKKNRRGNKEESINLAIITLLY